MMMSNQSIQTCPRCKRTFECKATDIMNCQCYGIQLSDEARQALEDYEQACLCRTCLLEVSKATKKADFLE